MEVLTSEQMKKIDAETIDRICPGLELMERAGRAVAEYILEESYTEHFKAVIFAGSGNNGGDGLVVARYLSQAGCPVSVHLLKSPERFPMDALKNYWRFSQIIKSNPQAREFDASRPDWPELAKKDLADASIIVDGIFGTGIAGPPGGRALEMVETMNESGLPIVSIDIPSGLQGDTGTVPGEAVRAGHTVTIGCPKLGLLFHPGKDFVGRMTVADIGFPPEIIEKYSQGIHLSDQSEAARRLPPRAPDAHKYRCGTLLLVAGSRAYTGAVLLAAGAALRGGCGMVFVGVPAGIRDVIEGGVWEAITFPLPETPEGTISPDALPVLAPYIETADALAIGPGLARNPETDRFVHTLIAQAKKPLVLDADGINAFAGKSELLKDASSPIVITPHTGELQKLVSCKFPGEPLARVEKTQGIANSLGSVLVHKGAPTLIASPEGGVWINASGGSSLATAGSGDVLTGLLGSFLAQGAPALDAALIACYLHGKAGEIAAAEMGVRGVVAGDLIHAICDVLLDVEELNPDGSISRPQIGPWAS